MEVTFMTPILLTLAFSLLTSPGDDRLPEPLRSLVSAERAFSEFSVDHGIKPAFLEFLGEEAIIFTPRATPGRKSYLEQPDEKEPRAKLVWRPVFADIAASGDFGYTTGPYELSFQFQREGVPQSRFGHYVTVWTKAKDHPWKVRIDKGIRHPERSTAPDEVRYPTESRKTPTSPARLDDLLSRDRTYSDLAARSGAGPAFDEIASDSVRLYRDGSVPAVGKKASLEALEKTPLKLSPEGGDVAPSGDLAFTYGVAVAENGETSTYLHIWKTEGGAWRLVLDNTTPLPKGS
jgi:ketosteroid isomerase-like protein